MTDPAAERERLFSRMVLTMGVSVVASLVVYYALFASLEMAPMMHALAGMGSFFIIAAITIKLVMG